MFLALVPAYNEARHISSVVRNLLPHVDRVVVIDDGSSDKTASEAISGGALVISHDINRGQGASLETGHHYARSINADFVLHFDGDGQFDVEDIAGAHDALTSANADILFGSRFLDDRSTLPWAKRFVIMPIARHINRVVSGLPLRDAHNGFRILNRRALDVVRMTQDGMAHATEIPSLVKKYHLRYIEFPVKVTYHEFGQGVRGGFRILKDLFFGMFIHTP